MIVGVKSTFAQGAFFSQNCLSTEGQLLYEVPLDL